MSDQQSTVQATDTPPKPFRHLHEACKWLGISPRKGEYEVEAGRLKAFWIAGHPHVMDEDLLAYVQDRVNDAAADRVIREQKRIAKAERRAERRAQKNEMAACAA